MITNTPWSLYRITHIPTGISAECANSRSMYKMRDAAQRLFRSKMASAGVFMGPQPLCRDYVLESDDELWRFRLNDWRKGFERIGGR